jgi:hypothetical protein
MLAVVLAVSFVPQSVEPIPSAVEAGTAIRIEVRGADRRGLEGVEVRVSGPAGAEVAGRSGPDGRLVFVPRVDGDHELEAEVAGVRLLAPLRVVPAPRRWWRFVVGLLGVAAVIAGVRGRRLSR